MTRDWPDDARRRLLDLRRGPGAWGYRGRSSPAVEPSSLAALALLADPAGSGDEGRAAAVASARRLASIRRGDGSLGATLDLPEAGWPTPFASLLWSSLGGFEAERSGAVAWLLGLEGRTMARTKGDPLGHDTSIVGWPWLAGTHSWVEPTAMALLALAKEGRADHPRALDGVRLLLDRAIPGGGWNLGNPVVFGTPLRPLPGPTGLALLALARLGDRPKAVDQAVKYLRQALAGTLAPISLGWGLLGLRAWGTEPLEAKEWLASAFEEVAKRDPRPVELAMLLLASGGRSLELLGAVGDATAPHPSPPPQGGREEELGISASEVSLWPPPPLWGRAGVGGSPYCPRHPLKGRPAMPDASTPVGIPPAGPSRRAFLAGAGLLASGTATALAIRRGDEAGWRADVFVAKAGSYDLDLAAIIRGGLAELGLGPAWARGKSVLLKPNLVEPSKAAPQINTHPAVVRAVAEVFRGWGAGEVFVAEGQGHCRDSGFVLEQSGLGPVLDEANLEFVDLNHDDVFARANRRGYTDLRTLHLPASLRRADLVVSLPKMKTHHWAGVTLAMKNLFGLMPGVAYGWPKNVLHHAGIPASILDINAAVRPGLAIVDGIVGMEGDGPIMGTPRASGVLVMGTNLPGVDATAARLMGIDPARVSYLAAASGWLGPIAEGHIRQRGERVDALANRYAILDHPSLAHLRA